jgi:hypothetical protein
VNREINNPAGEGGRNQQCIKIGPTVLRSGATSEQLQSIFEKMHPDLPDDEIETLVDQSVKYSKTDHSEPESVDVVRRRMLYQAAKSALPKIRQNPRKVPPALKIPLCEQRKLFLRTLFDAGDVVWIGEKWSSGENKKTKHKRTWAFKPRDQWLAMYSIAGCFTCPNTFKPGSYSRCDSNVVRRKYLVVESDILTMPEAMAVFATLEASHRLNPKALVFSGGKSLHAWFDWPAGTDANDWKALVRGYGCDPATLTASQPVRLPGTIRPDTGKPQSLLLVG